MSRHKKLYKLCLNALCTDIFQCRGKFPDRLSRFLFYREIKLSGKTHRPQNAKSIF